jgi:hypothetical protein
VLFETKKPIYFGSLEIFDGATMHIGTMRQIPNDTIANTFEVVRCKNHDLFYDLHHYNHNKLFLVNHKTKCFKNCAFM